MLEPDSLEATRREARRTALMRAAADIAVAAIGQRLTDAAGLGAFLTSTHAALASLSEAPAAQPSKPVPAVDPRKSVRDDHIVCLEDGRKFKSLKRHLMASYGLTPEAYRERWGLAPDYPMVAPSYAETRSRLARDMGLGRKPKSANGAAAH